MNTETSMSVIEGTDHPAASFALDENSVLARNKAILLAALAQRGASRAAVTYVGSGDSGAVDIVTFESAEGAVIDESTPLTVFAQRSQFQDGEWLQTIVEEEVPIEQALRDFAEEAIDLVHDGWEDGEGASGSIIFDSETATVRIEHMAYFTDSDYVETAL